MKRRVPQNPLINLLAKIYFVVNMMGKYKRIIALTLLLSLSLILILVAAEPISSAIRADGSSPEEKARIIFSMADKAKLRVEALLNSITANKTLMERINGENLAAILDTANKTFNLGIDLLKSANLSYENKDYANVAALAIESMNCFHDAYKELNSLLCKLGVLKDEVIEGQGLLIAIQCALERIERINKTLTEIASSNVNIYMNEVKLKLSEAKNVLNVTKATILLQQGNVSDVAHMLAESNRLINEALKELNQAIMNKYHDKVEDFKKKIERLRETIREKLKEMNKDERDFFSRWNFTDSEDFSRRQIEILERVRERLRLREGINATELKAVGRKIHEICLEIEIMLREREGEGFKGVKIEVDVEKTIESRAGRRVTATLRVTVRNAGSVAVTFPNSAFGITIERERNGVWEFYTSPISLQVLVSLKPGESGEVWIRLTAAEPGNYRVVVRALGKEGLQNIAVKNFELP